jgi:hypothetical protein
LLPENERIKTTLADLDALLGIEEPPKAEEQESAPIDPEREVGCWA